MGLQPLVTRTFADLAPVRERLRAFLAANEAVDNLLLAVLAGHAPGYDQPAAVAFAGDEVVGVAVGAPPPGRLLVLSSMAEDVARALARSLAESAALVPCVKGAPAAASAFAGEWQRITARGATLGVAERILRLQELRSFTAVDGRAIAATAAHFELLRSWCDAFQSETSARRGATSSERIQRLIERDAFCLWLGADDGPRSMAASTKETPNGAVLSFVHTPVEHRRQGYAASCVHALCQRLLGAGKAFVALYVDVANPGANALYSRLGFEEVGRSQEFEFEAAPP